MPNWLRALIAGYGAKKLGGGCFSTILVFVVIYYALGTCNKQQQPRTNQYNYNKPAHSSGSLAGISQKSGNTVSYSGK